VHAVLFYFEPDPDHLVEWREASAKVRTVLMEHPGYLEHVYMTVREPNPCSMFGVIYFDSRESMEAWVANPDHREAMVAGMGPMIRDYRVELCELYKGYTMADHVPGRGSKRYAELPTGKASVPLPTR